MRTLGGVKSFSPLQTWIGRPAPQGLTSTPGQQGEKGDRGLAGIPGAAGLQVKISTEIESNLDDEHSSGHEWLAGSTGSTRLQRWSRSIWPSRSSRTKRHYRYASKCVRRNHWISSSLSRLPWRTRCVYFSSTSQMRHWISLPWNVGLPGRDGAPGLPGSKGFGESSPIFHLWTSHCAYLFHYRWSPWSVRSWRYVSCESRSDDWILSVNYFLGEKGEPGLPGPGFPGNVVIFIVRRLAQPCSSSKDHLAQSAQLVIAASQVCYSFDLQDNNLQLNVIVRFIWCTWWKWITRSKGYATEKVWWSEK